MRKPGFLTSCLLLMLAACGQARPASPAATIGFPSAGQPTLTAVAIESASTRPTDVPVSLQTPAIATEANNALAATATTTPTPIILKTAGDFGDTRNPLTGEEVEDVANLQRRPLAIKISNAPARWVRPQSGFNDADLVFEHISEAGITRFTMIVYGRTPPDVGPIRSARLIDLELPAMYDAALIYSGSSEGVRQKLLSSDFRPRIIFPTEPGYYRTGADKPIEHTLYGRPVTLWEVLDGKGLNTRPAFSTNMTFSEEAPPGGEPASDFIVDYNWTLVEWKYDAEIGRYRRWADGEVHSDANTGEQVMAANVVVILANHVEDPNICEQVNNGACAAYSIVAQIWGTGPAVVFRDGMRYDATWQRINRNDLLTFYNQDGEPLPLQIGNTWFQVVPTWYTDPLTVVQ
jgi:hypothetical protein